MSLPKLIISSAEILDLSGELIVGEYLSSPEGPSGAVPDAEIFFLDSCTFVGDQLWYYNSFVCFRETCFKPTICTCGIFSVT